MRKFSTTECTEYTELFWEDARVIIDESRSQKTPDAGASRGWGFRWRNLLWFYGGGADQAVDGDAAVRGSEVFGGVGEVGCVVVAEADRDEA
jgi:hypothetical protein